MSYKKLEFRKGSSNSSFHFYSIQMHFDLDVNLFYFCRYMIDIFFFRDGLGILKDFGLMDFGAPRQEWFHWVMRVLPGSTDTPKAPSGLNSG